MNIKIDENLPAQVAVELRARKHDVSTVMEDGLSGHSDEDVWQAAQAEERVFMTQDLDFSDLKKFAPGLHHGLVLLRLCSPSRENLIQRVTELFDSFDVSTWSKCFVVATERKVRVRRAEK